MRADSLPTTGELLTGAWRFLLAAMLAGTPAQLARGAEPDAAAAPATPQTAAGHSYHGESFNEGPRQRAYLMGNTGLISFSATTASPEAQQFINQGVGQLHGFWYYEAERSFRQAAKLDPQCAIAYWGMALANTNNAKRAKGFLAEAVKRKAGAGEREKMYIDALEAYYNAESKGKDKERHDAYAQALEKILYKFPDDVAAWQQEASARVDHAYMLRDHILPDQIHNYAHNNEWLIRDLSHIGRIRQALALARNMIEIPRHPQYNTLSGGSASFGRMRLFEVLSRYELWDELIALCDTPYLDATENPADQV